MQFALGVLHWEPEAFWKSTMCEFRAAAEGHSKLHSHSEDDSDGVTFNELQELKEKLGVD